MLKQFPAHLKRKYFSTRRDLKRMSLHHTWQLWNTAAVSRIQFVRHLYDHCLILKNTHVHTANFISIIAVSLTLVYYFNKVDISQSHRVYYVCFHIRFNYFICSPKRPYVRDAKVDFRIIGLMNYSLYKCVTRLLWRPRCLFCLSGDIHFSRG